jgi:ketosteroid isomerase-like protein
MSRENVELVRGLQPPPDLDLVQAFGSDGQLLQALEPFVHEDVVVGGEMLGPRSDKVGLAGLQAEWAEWLEPWETYRTEIQDVIDAGDDSVLVLTRDSGRRTGMTIEVSILGAAVYTVRDSKIASVRFYPDREAAREAAGLPE